MLGRQHLFLLLYYFYTSFQEEWTVFLGTNLYFLRKRSGITQEALAQKLSVSRQSVSKWESGEAIPELGKLMEIADLFGCKLDELLREDITIREAEVTLFLVKAFQTANYVVVSADPENDARIHMDIWKKENQLSLPEENGCKQIGWGFPYVPEELKQRFGLRGYVAACLLPDNFQPVTAGAEIHRQSDCCYAALTIAEPNGRDARQISNAIRTILEYLRKNGIKKTAKEGFLPTFEIRYEQNGLSLADIFVQCQDPGKSMKLSVKEI